MDENIKNKDFRELVTKKFILRKVNMNDANELWDKMFKTFDDYKFYYPIKINTLEEYVDMIKKTS